MKAATMFLTAPPGTGSTIARRLRRVAAHGFTLIELMVVVAIIAILAAIAIPNYSSYVVNSSRAAAQGDMMSIASKQEQYLLANRTYASKAALGYTLDGDTASKYDWDVTLGTGTVPSYTITFTPKASQAADGAITLDSAGNKLPAAKWK